MTISDVLEYWATIYKALQHNPESEKLSEQRFFLVRYIDLENIFQRNIGQMNDLCMLYSITTNGTLKSDKKAEVSHQVWFLGKCKDTTKGLGRFSGIQQKQTNDFVISVCEDFISWLMEVKRTGMCPITKRDFRTDPQLQQELTAVNVESVGYGTLPELYANQWIIGGVDWLTFNGMTLFDIFGGVNWQAIKPLYNFNCGARGKYVVKEESEEPTGTDDNTPVQDESESV